MKPTARCLLALSGGVDSSVLAALLSEAVGEQLTCIFVDHGLLRKNEGDEAEVAFAGRKLNCHRINAQSRFLDRLRSVQTSDFMTADWSRLPYELMDRVSGRIVNEVPGVNRVLYDITSKPPATVEYE